MLPQYRLNHYIWHKLSAKPQYVKGMKMLITQANLILCGLDSTPQSILIRDNKIVRVGARVDGVETADDVLDAGGRLVVPGFFDSHAHILGREFDVITVDFDRTQSVEELLAQVVEKEEEVGPREWIVGINWDDSKIRGIEKLSRRLLDKTGLDNPIFLQRVCGHAAFLNRRALGILAEERRSSEMAHLIDFDNGRIEEDAVHLVRELVQLGRGDRLIGIERSIASALSLGITSVCEMHCLPQQFELMREAATNIRLFAYLDYIDDSSFGELARLEPTRLCRAAGLKLVADGSIGARTAAVSRPFHGTDSHGRLLLEKDDLVPVVREALRRGVQLAVHAIGDRAIESVIAAYEEAGAERFPDHRHRLEHLEVLPRPFDETLDRLKRTGLIASMQPDFITSWGHEDAMYGERFGPDWNSTNAFGLVFQRGIPLAFGSDSMPIGPIYGLRGAVEHPNEDSRLDLADAIAAYTAGGAYAVFGEGNQGRITPGMAADLTLLSCKTPDCILDAEVDATIMDGQVVFQRS